MARTSQKGLNPELISDALERVYGNITAAATLLKVSRTTIQHYVNTYPEVRKAMEAAAAEISDIAESNLIQAIKAGDLRQSQYWLENKARDRGYGQKYTPQVNMTMQDLLAMDEAGLDKLITQLAKLG
jgi:hypothetical protein